MKKYLLWALSLVLGSASYAEDITIRYKGSKAKVEQKVKDSVTVAVDGAKVDIVSLYTDHKLTLRLTGKSDDGQLMLKTAGKAKIILDGLTLTSQEGAPLWLKNKKKVEVKAAKGTTNLLTITACNDTANHKAAAIWAKDKLLFSGEGTLNIVATGKGCRGIKTKKDITFEDLILSVTTSGDNLGEKPFGFGDFGGFPNFGNDSTKFGGFPGFPMPNDSAKFGGFPPFGNDSTGFGGGFGGKHKYYAATKGIASKGKITINSGNIDVHTSTAGAEGIEGKGGIIFNGGNIRVDSPDDAISANACIEFNGANVIAHSTGNDAIDSNPKGGFFMPFGANNEQDNDPAIIIRGGKVYAWSEVGPPEEGIDCDFAPLVVEGGTVFSVGGGMGEMPSVPTQKTAKQPTVLLIGVDITKDEPVSIYDADGQRLDQVTIPFSMKRSASLVTSPAFKLSSTYTVKTKGYEKTFTLNDNFTTVR